MYTASILYVAQDVANLLEAANIWWVIKEQRKKIVCNLNICSIFAKNLDRDDI